MCYISCLLHWYTRTPAAWHRPPWDPKLVNNYVICSNDLAQGTWRCIYKWWSTCKTKSHRLSHTLILCHGALVPLVLPHADIAGSPRRRNHEERPWPDSPDGVMDLWPLSSVSLVMRFIWLQMLPSLWWSGSHHHMVTKRHEFYFPVISPSNFDNSVHACRFHNC
jgi:hypothetical protein